MADFSDREQPDVLCLFDVDGTITVARDVRHGGGGRGRGGASQRVLLRSLRQGKKGEVEGESGCVYACVCVCVLGV